MNYTLMLFVAAEQVEKTKSFFDIPAPWLALFGTIFGGVGLKVVEGWLNKPSRRDSTPAELRQELRQQVEGLKEDVARLTSTIDTTEAEMLLWRDKYYELLRTSALEHQKLLDAMSEIAAIRALLKNDSK